jgi:alanyl-tRNA synthetase
VAAGVRRIEAISGKAAAAYVDEQASQLRSIRDVLKAPKDLVKSVENLIADNNELRKRIESLEAKQLVVIRKELLEKKEQLGNVQFIGAVVEVGSADALKKLCFELKNELQHYFVVLAANVEGKPQVAILIDEALSAEKNLEAPRLIKEHVAGLIKGGGGGQKTLATAGGQDASNLPKVIAVLRTLVA